MQEECQNAITFSIIRHDDAYQSDEIEDSFHYLSSAIISFPRIILRLSIQVVRNYIFFLPWSVRFNIAPSFSLKHQINER